MTSKAHYFTNAIRVYAAELICSTGVLGFQTFKLTLSIYNKKFFPLRLKYLEKSQIYDLLSPSLFRNKRVSSCHLAATFAKINK